VDELLGELNKEGYYAVGYADDIAILINGKFPQTVSEVLQTALGLVEQWCDRTGFSINPSKTAVIPFTKKRVLKGLKELTLFGKTIQLPTEVKYLGLTLDKGLTWGAQLDKVAGPTGPFGSVKALSERHWDKTMGSTPYTRCIPWW
jgi:hypothetical protein